MYQIDTMLISGKTFTIVFVLSFHLIGQLSAQTHEKFYPISKRDIANGTTTPVPMANVTKSSIIPHATTTTTTAVPPSEKTTSSSIPTTLDEMNKTSEIPNFSSTPVIKSTSSTAGGKTTNFFSTTTAAPPTQRPEYSYHRFDTLSFIGGGLCAISLIALGTITWKVYLAHIERRYWTL